MKVNVRRTLHIIDHVQRKRESAILVDAEKAFDSVNWTFLYKVLTKKKSQILWENCKQQDITISSINHKD